FSQDLLFLAPDAVLPARLRQFLPFAGDEAVAAPTLVPVSLPQPGANRLVRTGQVMGALLRRASARADQPHRLRPELRRVGRVMLRHVDSFPGGQDPQCSGVHGTGATPPLDYSRPQQLVFTTSAD